MIRKAPDFILCKNPVKISCKSKATPAGAAFFHVFFQNKAIFYSRGCTMQAPTPAAKVRNAAKNPITA